MAAQDDEGADRKHTEDVSGIVGSILPSGPANFDWFSAAYAGIPREVKVNPFQKTDLEDLVRSVIRF